MGPTQILHLDQPRSGSHLLQRILSRQPKLTKLDHPFSQSRGKQVDWLLSEDYAEGMNGELNAAFDAEVEKGIRQWEQKLAQASRCILSLHDHTFDAASAETVLRMFPLMETCGDPPEEGENILDVPDELLLRPGTIPVFSIRDPRATVPANYRVLHSFGLDHAGGAPLLSMTTNLIWTRLLYNFFMSNGVEPVIVDADDVMTDRDFVRRLCSRLGLDPEKAIFDWSHITESERTQTHPMLYKSQRTLFESVGIDARLAVKNRDMEAEEKGWEEEFGKDVGMVRGCVERAMPHYRWLVERRFR